MPLFLVENIAVEKFMENKEDVSEKYRYRKYDQKYIVRDKVLPLYLTETNMARIEEYMKKIDTTKSNIVLQALENICKEYDMMEREKNEC